MAGHEKLSTAKAELARVSEAPAGKTAPETARGGEFELTRRYLEEIRVHLSMQAFDLRKTASRGVLPHVTGLALERMADWELALVRAIDELRSRHE